MMTIEEIQARKECQTFDCKSIQIDPKALAIPIVAMANADGIFNEFRNRFHKEHASEIKFDVLCDYIFRHDNELFGTFYYKYSPLKIEAYSTFSFVEKNKGVTTDVPIKDAVKLYRAYYKEKLKTMKVPITYTNRNRPEWSI